MASLQSTCEIVLGIASTLRVHGIVIVHILSKLYRTASNNLSVFTHTTQLWTHTYCEIVIMNLHNSEIILCHFIINDYQYKVTHSTWDWTHTHFLQPAQVCGIYLKLFVMFQSSGYLELHDVWPGKLSLQKYRNLSHIGTLARQAHMYTLISRTHSLCLTKLLK